MIFPMRAPIASASRLQSVCSIYELYMKKIMIMPRETSHVCSWVNLPSLATAKFLNLRLKGELNWAAQSSAGWCWSWRRTCAAGENGWFPEHNRKLTCSSILTKDFKQWGFCPQQLDLYSSSKPAEKEFPSAWNPGVSWTHFSSTNNGWFCQLKGCFCWVSDQLAIEESFAVQTLKIDNYINGWFKMI